jgi:hypothetical protein
MDEEIIYAAAFRNVRTGEVIEVRTVGNTLELPV